MTAPQHVGNHHEGLLLRPPAPGDRVRMLELAHDPLQLAYGVPVGVPVPEEEADLDERVARSRAAYERLEPGDLTVADAADPDRFLASVAWRHDVPALLRIADVGYSVHADARGRGVAVRSLRALVHWLLVDPGGPRQQRVQLDHSVENPASCRTALAAGMPREGVRRGFLPLRGESGDPRRHDVCLHGLPVHDVLGPPA